MRKLHSRTASEDRPSSDFRYFSMFPITGRIKDLIIAARATRLTYRLFAFAHDLVMSAASFAISITLRLGFDEARNALFGDLLPTWILFTAICAAVFWQSGISRGVWRYTSMNDMIVIARTVTLAVLIYCVLTFALNRLDAVPRSTLIINWMVLGVFISAPRLACRLYSYGGMRQLWKLDSLESPVPVILIGTGDSAELFIRAIAHDRSTPYHVLGLLDEEGEKTGLNIHGRPVLGHVTDLPAVLERFKTGGKTVQHVILTKSLQRDVVQGVMQSADAAGTGVARLPSLTEFKKGISDDIQIQPVALEDLLGRTQTKLDHDCMRRHVEGQRVLVTGAGGSIGSELARQVAALSPAHLALLDVSETLLYSIDLEISELYPNLSRRSIIADVRDRPRIGQAIASERPSLVFHAAALKHVPMVESNKIEGVLTNAIGTRNLADACCHAGVNAMVMISTDKAVNPTSTMGASKRLAEQYCQALNGARNRFSDVSLVTKNSVGVRQAPHFVTVRFGNVLGSNGSVVPLFKRQLAAGGPLTVTHPEMTRYFMTCSEAVELVLQATVMGLEQSEDDGGNIYVLDMGKPIKIMDLARQVIRLSGLKPDEDIKIKITGARPGEKINEELFHNSEILRPTVHPSVQLASPRHANLETVTEYLNVLEEACRHNQEGRVLWYLRKFIPEYEVDVPEERDFG